MITREQYNQALDTIEQYHKQLFEGFFITKNRNWHELAMGDFIVFEKSQTKNILTNKPYQVTYVSPKWKSTRTACYGIIMENGKEKWLKKYAQGYRVRLT